MFNRQVSHAFPGSGRIGSDADFNNVLRPFLQGGEHAVRVKKIEHGSFF